MWLKSVSKCSRKVANEKKLCSKECSPWMMISLTTFLIDRFNNVATEATVIKRFVELIDWHYFILQFGKVFKEHLSKNGVLCTTNSRVFFLWVL